MENQHRIYDDKEAKQSNMQASKLKNYRDFFKHITSTSNNDMDIDVNIDADESTQTIRGNFHG